MSQPIIEVNGLGKRYRLGQFGFSSFREEAEKWLRRMKGEKVEENNARDFWALRDVTFSVQPGEVLGIIGRNGAGKSTLLKLLSRITEPTKGEVVLRGRVASLLEVGTGFHPELSGRENIYLNGAILGMTRAEVTRKFDEIVAFAEVDKFVDTPVKRYSSGMYVKLAFSVAAHLEPEILIVDEVLAVGDADFQRKCVAKMEEVSAGSGRTVLFVSHNMGLVQSLCRRGVLLKGGGVEFQGEVRQAVDIYLSKPEGATTELAAPESRPGRGTTRFTEIKAVNELGVSGLVETGRALTFRFGCTRTRPGLRCLFTIYDQFGAPLSLFNSANISVHDKKATDAEFICHLPEVLLAPGRYRVNAALESGHDMEDHVDGALFFDVIEGQVNGRAVLSLARYGNLVFKHTWETPA